MKDASEEQMHEYEIAIIFYLSKCKDVEMLDFILKLLQKTIKNLR